MRNIARTVWLNEASPATAAVLAVAQRRFLWVFLPLAVVLVVILAAASRFSVSHGAFLWLIALGMPALWLVFFALPSFLLLPVVLAAIATLRRGTAGRNRFRLVRFVLGGVVVFALSAVALVPIWQFVRGALQSLGVAA